MDLAEELEENKNKIYAFYSLVDKDIQKLGLDKEMIFHIISKFEGYNHNPILLINSLDVNIKKILLKLYNIPIIFHNFFVWYNYFYNYGKCLDNYCDYKNVLDLYYDKNLEMQNKIIDNFYRQKLKHELPHIESGNKK